jgi:hypothetical protein
MRELRHDFRVYYHCCYDECAIDEACDLVSMLPDGAAYIRATDFKRSWTDEQNRQADLFDQLWVIASAMRGADVTKAPKVTRPTDVAARLQASKKKRSVSDRINNGKWEEA